MTNTLLRGLVQLGKWFRGEMPGAGSDDPALLAAAEAQNRWFTPEFIRQAMQANGAMLMPDTLSHWMGQYPDFSRATSPQRIGLVLAGNLPMVGWHDVLCTLLCGHAAVVKCSSNDALLIPAAIQALRGFLDDETQVQCEVVTGKLESVDAVIATGSANSNRYFEYYFRELPKVLRSQRTSAAVLTGEETPETLRSLGSDIFQYYGMGCRSVTKLFVPQGFDLDRLFSVWVEWGFLAQNNKYANNYDYHKAVWLLNREDLIENGFVLLKRDSGWVSPVGTLYYEPYSDLVALRNRLDAHADELQCVVTQDPKALGVQRLPMVQVGHAQSPAPWDYADQVDTISFLLALSSTPVSR